MTGSCELEKASARTAFITSPNLSRLVKECTCRSAPGPQTGSGYSESWAAGLICRSLTSVVEGANSLTPKPCLLPYGNLQLRDRSIACVSVGARLVAACLGTASVTSR